MRTPTLLLTLFCAALGSCGKPQRPSQNGTLTAINPARPDPLALILAPQTGDGVLDKQIRQVQQHIRSGETRGSNLERLGWLYVAKARETFDSGYYKLAEQCAVCLEQKQKGSSEALFLRGCVLNNLHRFKEAELLANELVDRRGMAADFGLLGDALMEQGQLDRAANAYQRMIDSKPDVHALLRAAHLRWLKGDVAGATELVDDAARSINPRDRDTAAWALTRLAAYKFQSGLFETAQAICDEALAIQHEYPPALLLAGRILLAHGDSRNAVKRLRRAADLVPLPEYQWALAEALEITGDQPAASAVENDLRRTGEAADPRTMALFLATRGESKELAVQLAKEELKSRQDVFTEDALAWALTAAGRIEEARNHETRALAEGTQDARLFFHAAVLAERAADAAEASKWVSKASTLRALLLPSERGQLSQLAERYFPNQSIGLAGVEK